VKRFTGQKVFCHSEDQGVHMVSSNILCLL